MILYTLISNIILPNVLGNENRKEYVEIKETEYSWFFEKVIRKAEEFENMEKEMFLKYEERHNCI